MSQAVYRCKVCRRFCTRDERASHLAFSHPAIASRAQSKNEPVDDWFSREMATWTA